jgi:hypothetical protein
VDINSVPAKDDFMLYLRVSYALPLLVSTFIIGCGRLDQYQSEYENFRTSAASAPQSADQATETGAAESASGTSPDILPAEGAGGPVAVEKNAGVSAEDAGKATPPPAPQPTLSCTDAGKLAADKVQRLTIFGNNRQLRHAETVEPGKVLIFEVEGNNNEIVVDISLPSSAAADAKIPAVCAQSKGNGVRVQLSINSHVAQMAVNAIGNSVRVRIEPKDGIRIDSLSKSATGNDSDVQ